MPIAEINHHQMYCEVHGDGQPVLCMGGWGTYCHGGEGALARGLTDRYSVIIFDYRGIGESSDPPGVEPTIRMHAADAIGLLDQLGITRVHLIGLVGIGACVCQEIAMQRPDLARSMVNMGAWARVDAFLRDQLECLRIMHRDAGFASFQQLVSVMSFRPDFYNANRERLLGPDGGWKELNGRYATHSRLIDACLSHDVSDRLPGVGCPTLVIHAGQDQVTSPRTTLPIELAIPNAEGLTWADVAHVIAGKDQKIRFCDSLFGFLDGVEAGERATGGSG
jgi:3-oxoadipate enol-lactonase